MYDAVIVGGGPVGSRLAYQLALAGYKIGVLEKKAQLGQPVCCTGIISEECVRLFDIQPSCIFRTVNEAFLESPAGKIIKVWHPTVQAYLINRRLFDLYTAQQAIQIGAEYHLNTNVQKVEIKKDRTEILAENSSQQKVYSARCVVIAAGYGSCRLIENSSDFVGDFAIGAQAEVEYTTNGDTHLFFNHQYAPGFFSWLVPYDDKHAFVGLISRQNTGNHFNKFIFDLYNKGMIRSSEVIPAFRTVPLNFIKKTSGHRWLTVGSSAGQVKPLTGGGIYYGLLCADIAAQTLITKLKNDDLSTLSLKEYERNWKKKLGNEIRTSYWARQFFEQMSDAQLDRGFEFVQNKRLIETLASLDNLSFDWHSQTISYFLKSRIISSFQRLIRNTEKSQVISI